MDGGTDRPFEGGVRDYTVGNPKYYNEGKYRSFTKSYDFIIQ